jgi:renalase
VVDCTIIGAGISGLLAAKMLSDAGLTVQVLEKGRGLGGRMATRRRNGAIFDHGAQFFTVRDQRFATWVERWKSHGLVDTWYDLEKSGRHYRGVPGMTGIAKQLSEGIDVHRETLVKKVFYSLSEKRWTVTSADDEVFESRALITTAPIPQSLALLTESEVFIPEKQRQQLASIRYHRCIAAMAILDRPSPITEHNGALKLGGEPIQWMADNQRKGVSPELPAITIHSTPNFAETHWDTPNDERVPLLLEAASPHLGEAKIISYDGHRWGFSQPASAFGEEAYIDASIRLAIAGDGMTGGRVEGAAISGIAAAKKIKKLLLD